MTYKISKFEQTPKGLSAIVEGIRRIFYAPIESFIIILVMGIALFLAITSYLLWKNKEAFYDNWNISAEISVYLKEKIDAQKVDLLVEELKTNGVIAKLELIRSDDGMKAFMENTSLTALLSSFKENPLPNVIIIHPKIKALSRSRALKFIGLLKDYAEVDVVKADLNWIERSHSWLNLLDTLLLFFVVILILNALLIFCGGSFAMSKVFVDKWHASKIILQYQFAWYGLISSLLVLLLSKIILIVFQDHDIFLCGLKAPLIIFILVVGSLLSLVSSRLASR